MRVIAHIQKCISGGNCVLSCSEVFDQGDSDGIVRVLNGHPPLELIEKVRKAVELCPAQVFVVEDAANTAELVVVEDDREIS